MAQPRFFQPPEAIDTEAGLVLITEARIVSQIRHVLRLKVGDGILVLDGLGNLYRCALRSLGPTAIRAEVLDCERARGEAAVRVTIGLPLLKGDRFDWAIQKLTELGVAQLVPLTCERTVVKGPSETKLPRWQLIAREAAEQCERSTIPHIVSPTRLEDLVTGPDTITGGGIDLSLICTERRKAPLLQSLLHDQRKDNKHPNHILALIGPEGGFSDREVAMAQAAGMTPVSLGPRILRAETAAIYSLSLVIAELDETEN